MTYRATPLPWCGYSPAQLLMGRNIRTNILQVAEHLAPQLPNYKKFRKDDEKFKKSQKANYDKRHRTSELRQSQMILKFGSPPTTGKFLDMLPPELKHHDPIMSILPWVSYIEIVETSM